MRAVLQRVLNASVEVDGNMVSSIGKGLMVLAGLHESDTERDMEYIAGKIIGARIFNDAGGVMNLAVGETGGEVLLVSQFTLYGDIRRGKRPSYSSAMKPDPAREAFSRFVEICTSLHPATRAGIFGADMKISLVNDGPITILVDSGRLF
jgi:D-aminoacyl-tRNA deacylase